jgi:hypothetical protein
MAGERARPGIHSSQGRKKIRLEASKDDSGLRSRPARDGLLCPAALLALLLNQPVRKVDDRVLDDKVWDILLITEGMSWGWRPGSAPDSRTVKASTIG